MEIRTYKPTDFSHLIELVELNTPLYFAPDESQDFIDYLNNHMEDYFVVVLDGLIVGSGGINYPKGDSVAYISWDIIHPEFQRKGIGSKLLGHRINWISQNPKIYQVVVRTTQHVYEFYEKAGFELIKKERDYWAPGFDLYHMKMRIR
jgi:ribosomal protein S18 acetylase RimI-like enzyme